MILNNFITEAGFILLGGMGAFIPVYILGLILKGGTDDSNNNRG